MSYKRVFFILADGVRPDVLKELVEQGALPSIAEAFPEPGNRREGISVFPSTTGPAFLPFMTGCFPGTMNMPGIRWFDRRAWAERNGDPYARSYVGVESWKMNSDVREGYDSIFQILPNSYNIFSSIAPGIRRKGDVASFSRGFWWLFGHETYRWDIVHKRGVRNLLKTLDKNPDFVFSLVPDVDTMSHVTNPRSVDVMAAYRRLDGMIGTLFSELDRRGWRDDSLVFMVADHGFSSVHTHLGLPEWMIDLGMRPYYYPKIWKRTFDSAVMISGNGMSHINVRGGDTWTGEPVYDDELFRLYPELMTGLLERKEIALVITRSDENTVVVRSSDGHSVIARHDDGTYTYAAVNGDAFGYDDISGRLTGDEFLAFTCNTKYPDAIVQLTQIFDSERTGDILVSAEVGYDLRDKHERPEHHAGHGALHEEHLRVPLYCSTALPDIPMRTVDIFPAMLHLLDKPIPEGIDGRNVFTIAEEFAAES